MKKLAVIFVTVLIVTGVAVVFFRPQWVNAQPGKPGSEASSKAPAEIAQQLFSKAKSALSNVAVAKTSKPASPKQNPSLKIINESQAEALPTDDSTSTNAAEQHDPKIQAGLKAVHQLSVRGILVSGSRSSAIIQTGRQTTAIFAGDTLNVKTQDGLVTLHCEKIDRRTVWIRIPQTPVLAELSLP